MSDKRMTYMDRYKFNRMADEFGPALLSVLERDFGGDRKAFVRAFDRALGEAAAGFARQRTDESLEVATFIPKGMFR